MLKTSGLAIPKAKATLVTADGILSREHSSIGCDEMVPHQAVSFPA